MVVYPAQEVRRSFYNKAFYREVLHQKKGYGFAHHYHWLVAVLLMALIVVTVMFSFWRTAENAKYTVGFLLLDGDVPVIKNISRMLWIANHIPQIHISEGEMEIVSPPELSRYYTNDEHTGREFFIFDETETPPLLEDTKAMILFAKERIYWRDSPMSSVESVYYTELFEQLSLFGIDENEFNIFFEVASSLPEMKYEGGYLQLRDETIEQPLYIQSEISGNVYGVFDTIQTNRVDMAKDYFFITTHDQLILFPNSWYEMLISWPELQTPRKVFVDFADWQFMVKKAVFAVAIALILFCYAITILLPLFLALLLKISAYIYRYPLNWRDAIRLGCFMLPAPFILGVFVFPLMYIPMWFTLVLCGVWVHYVSGVLSNDHGDDQVAE